MVQHGERSTRVAASDEARAVPTYQKILVGTDGSAASLRAGDHAVYLAGRLGSEGQNPGDPFPDGLALDCAEDQVLDDEADGDDGEQSREHSRDVKREAD